MNGWAGCHDAALWSKRLALEEGEDCPLAFTTLPHGAVSVPCNDHSDLKTLV